MKKKAAKKKIPTKKELKERKQIGRLHEINERFSKKLAGSLAQTIRGEVPKDFEWASLNTCAEWRGWSSAFYREQFDLAYELQENMDTNARDELPTKIFNFLEDRSQ